VLTDNVLELQVVTGRGERLTCSPTRNPGLFDAVRAGLGQVAVVAGATLGLVSTPERVGRFLLHYPDLATMLEDQRLLTAERRFDAVQGAVLPTPTGTWLFRLDLVKDLYGSPADEAALLAGLSDDRARAELSTLPYLDYLDRLAALERLLRSEGWWSSPHPWLTTFVGDAAVEAVVADELAALTPADLGPLGQVVVSPIVAASVRTPLLRLPPDPLCFTFNLIRLPATDDAAEARRLVTANRGRSMSGSGTPVGRRTRSAPSRCRRPTGAHISGRPSMGSPRPSASTTRATCSRPATRSSLIRKSP
jgi:hypothetical protein